MANKILLLEGIHSGAKTKLEEVGFEVELLAPALSAEELLPKLKNVIALGIRSKTQLTEKVLQSASHLHVVGAFCIGTNQIATPTANLLGIPVFNAPYSNTRSVAELVICEMIALSRRLGDVNSLAHNGEWLKSAVGNREVRGKTLGIVGYGHIGSQVSVLAESLGLNVIFHDIMKKLPLGNATPVDSLEDLLEKSDFVTLHVPETSLTQNMMAQKQLARMKKGSFLINASRGTVVDIGALASALQSQHLAGAAVDVFPEEPESNNQKFKSELQGLRNVILTPHIGGSTEEAQVAIGQEVAESMIRYLKAGSTFGSVNFPQVDPPPMKPKAQRLINVHQNIPGVMMEINGRVSKAGANIVAQYLSTDAQIGCVVMDFEGSPIHPLVDEIAGLKFSIKTRQV